MPAEMVRWSQLISTFRTLYPRTLEQVLSNSESAQVNFVGTIFYIDPDQGHDGFTIWGPPFINNFPN